MLYWIISGRSRAILNRKAQLGGTALGVSDIIELVRVCHASGIASDGSAADYAAVDAVLAPQRERFYNGLLATPPDSFSDRAQAFSFWINLYNLLILDAVTTFHVRRATVGWSQGIMRFFEKAAYNVGGHRFSANDIENGVLRANAPHPAARGPHFRDGDPRCAAVLEPIDPRVHFALNCASRSCPYARIYEPERLDEQLDAATRAFVAGDVQVDSVSREVTLSKIFAWFAPDFEDAGGALATAIQYMPENDGVRLWLEQHRESVTVKFRPYDWHLNTSI